MNLDILRTEWAARDEKLESALRLNARLLKAGLIDRRRAEIRGKLPFGAFSAIVSVATIVLLGSFIARNLRDPEFLVPACMLLGWTVAVMVADLRQRAAMQRLDFGEPTVALLKKLEAMKVSRLTATRWAFLTGQVVWWIPLAIVAFKGLLGVNLYTVNDFMPKFIAINLLLGLAFIPAWIGIAKRVVGRFEGSPGFQRITDAVAGEDLVKARQFLEELARFEKE